MRKHILGERAADNQEQASRGFTKETWIVLVLFAFLVLTNGVFILALIFFPSFTFSILIGFAISHISFFFLMVLAAFYYSRRK